MIGKEKALDITRRALRCVEADQVEVMLLAERFTTTRYCYSTIHQNLERNDLLVSIRVMADGGLGHAYTSSSNEQALRKAGQQALALARTRAGTSSIEFSAGGAVATLPTFFESTAACGPAERAYIVGQMADVATEAGFTINGAFQVESNEMAVMTSAGAELYAPLTAAGIRLAVTSDDGGIGYAESVGRDVSQLDPVALARRATAKCRLNHKRQSLPPGEYVTILEEIAVADLLRFIGTLGLNGQALLEGRSFAGGCLGERLMDSRLTLRDDPWDPRGLCTPFDPEGISKHPLVLIDRGIVRQVVHDIDTAKQSGTASTGHAAPPDPEAFLDYPAPTNMFLEGGDSSLDEMIANTERGILVTALHYTNSPDPKRLAVTGMTRDGTFLIQDGQIYGAVFNQRFHQNVLEMLNDVLAVSRETEMHRDWWNAGGTSMQHGKIGACAHCTPAIKVGKFRYIGESPVA